MKPAFDLQKSLKSHSATMRMAADAVSEARHDVLMKHARMFKRHAKERPAAIRKPTNQPTQ